MKKKQLQMRDDKQKTSVNNFNRFRSKHTFSGKYSDFVLRLCGGMMGDPYEGVTIKDSLFSALNILRRKRLEMDTETGA
jgi:hypothetical protein